MVTTDRRARIVTWLSRSPPACTLYIFTIYNTIIIYMVYRNITHLIRTTARRVNLTRGVRKIKKYILYTVGLRADDYLRSTCVRQVGVMFLYLYVLLLYVCTVLYILYPRKTSARETDLAIQVRTNDYYIIIMCANCFFCCF